MATINIKAWVYNTESEMQSVIDAIDIVKGYPSDGAETYCRGVLNNGKWVIKRTPEMDENFQEPAVDFEFIEPNS